MKCKHLILIWVKTTSVKFGQWEHENDFYKCKSCDRLFTINEWKVPSTTKGGTPQ